MSAAQKCLASHILKEHFGELIEKVGAYLVGKGPRSLKEGIQETGLKKDEVQKALCSLIQHDLVSFEKNKKGATIYNVCIANILLYTRFPRYTYCAKTMYGEEAELILEHILQQGADTMSRVVEKVNERYGAEDSDSEVRMKFAELVQGHFLKRVRILPQESEDTEAIVELEQNVYVLPPGVMQGGLIYPPSKHTNTCCTPIPIRYTLTFVHELSE